MSIPIPVGVRLAVHVSPASWVTERLWPWGKESVRLGSFLPEGFPNYVRILHPAHTVGDETGSVRWAAIARENNKAIGPETTFQDVANIPSEDRYRWDETLPSVGNLPREQFYTLARLLGDCTSTADRCWFCVWEGYGFWMEHSHQSLTAYREVRPWILRRRVEVRRRQEEERKEFERISKVRHQHRAYLLFEGALSTSAFEFDGWWQSPNLWWPDDQAWCVATEIDGYSTYVGCGTECARAIMEAPELEALEVDLDASVA